MSVGIWRNPTRAQAAIGTLNALLIGAQKSLWRPNEEDLYRHRNLDGRAEEIRARGRDGAHTEVVTFREDAKYAFCQLRFASRERVLVSIASKPTFSIRLYRLILGGRLPIQILWELSQPADEDFGSYGDLFIRMFGSSRQRSPLSAVRETLLPLREAADAVVILLSLEGRARAARRAEAARAS